MGGDSIEEINLYTDMLVDGFKNDPGVQFQLAVLEKAAIIFQAQCKAEVEAFYNLGLLYAENDEGFLIGFSTQDSQTARFSQAFEQATQYLQQVVTTEELAAMQTGVMELTYISKPDWYIKYLGAVPVYTLQAIVVRPQLRGTGVFRKLMMPLIERCENEGMPVVLQTHNPENVPKYEHFGFELVESICSDKIGITCYNMLKKAN